MQSRRRVFERTLAPFVAAALATTGLVGCSNQQSSVNRRPHTGSTTAAAVDGVQQVIITANDTDRFTPSTITVHPGKVQIVLIDRGGAPHNWTLAGIAATPLTTSGETQSVTFTAPTPGTYTFVCTIHERQGQTGKLVVLSS